MLLDLPSNSRDGSNTSAGELCSLETRGKHILDECGILVDFEWMSNELELLYDLNTLIDV
jgi:hypothetical protein